MKLIMKQKLTIQNNMKKISIIKKIFLVFIVSIILSTPVISFAQDKVNIKDSDVNKSVIDIGKDILAEQGKYTFIAPFGPFANLMNDTTDLTNPGALGDYLKTWFKFLVGIGGVIGVVRLVMAGFEIITKSGSIDAVSRAKKEIVAIVSSLVLVALSWVILNSLNPDLVTKSLILPSTLSTTSAPPPSSDGQQDFQIGVTKAGYYYKATNIKSGNVKYEFGSANNYDDCLKLAKLNKSTDYTIDTEKCYDFTKFSSSEKENANREMMAKYNIFAKSRGCNNQAQCGCTYLGGINEVTLKKIIELAGNCCGGQPDCTDVSLARSYSPNCPVVITAGAETCGHKSHGGPNTLDLRMNSKVEDFLRKNAIYIAPSFDQNIRYKYKGMWYTHEDGGTGVHYHICAATAARNGSSSSCADLASSYTSVHCKPTGLQVSEGEQMRCR